MPTNARLIRFLKETELAQAVIAWLADQHWDIYQEVQFRSGSAIADIVAVRHGIVWIIETKTAYGFAVLDQATRWPVHYRSVAVPEELHVHRDYRVATDYYRVGVLTVKVDTYTGEPSVYEARSAPLMRMHHRMAKNYASRLLELHKTFAPAGSNGSRHLTPYKLTMMEIRKYVATHPGCTIKTLYEALGEMHYASKASFLGNVVKSLVDFERDWCKVDDSAKPYTLWLR